MKVVLNQDVKGIGKKLEIVNVSEGYARNYLLPKNIAKIADDKALNETKGKIQSQKFRKEKEKEEALKLKQILDSKYIEFKCKTGENGKLFGSVTEKDIAEKIKTLYNIDIDKKKIKLTSSIKEIGMYIAQIKVYESIIAKIKIGVVGL